MRKTPWLLAEKFRHQMPNYESRHGDAWGAFIIPYCPTGARLRALVSDGNAAREEFGDEFAWDHVSVSVANRIPTWEEMCYVKSLFWADDETVMQLHVPLTEHINCHTYTLHLWKPLLLAIPRPPSKMV